MQKQSPSIGALLTMVAFTLSVFGLLLFLWLSFGGPLPLAAEGYRFKVAIPEAVSLAGEADVRISGVTVGKVKSQERAEDAPRTLVTVELDSEFAPIPQDTKAVLRSKTLLGEAYVELTPGDRESGMLDDGARLPDAQVEQTVELDEILSTLDSRTRTFFRRWMHELARAVRGRRGRDLNEALGQLAGFTVGGRRVFEALDERRDSLRLLVRNGGVVFGAINDRRGALRALIDDANGAFEAIASRDEALAETVEVLPTFLDETRATLVRLDRFAQRTRPLVRDLRPVADDLGPTVRDLGDLAPDLESALRDLTPLARTAARGLPALERVARGAGPVVETLHPFLAELNPVLSYLGFFQARISGFLTNGGANINADPGGERAQLNTALVDTRSFERFTERPEWDRGNTYLQPNALNRTIALGVYEALDCSNAEGPRNRLGDVPQDDAIDTPPPLKTFERRPACLVPPESLYDGSIVPLLLEPGEAPVVPPPEDIEGTLPARERPPVEPTGSDEAARR